MNEILVGALELLSRLQRECEKIEAGQTGEKKWFKGVENKSLKENLVPSMYSGQKGKRLRVN